MAARHQKLEDALRLQHFLRDVEDEEDWIKEKEPIAASTNRGKWSIVWECSTHEVMQGSYMFFFHALTLYTIGYF